MRKRNIQISLRVNDKELEKINALVSKCGLSREEFIRSAAVGCVLKERPSADFFETVRLLRICGENINQIARKVNSCGSFDEALYKENYNTITKQIDSLFEYFG